MNLEDFSSLFELMVKFSSGSPSTSEIFFDGIFLYKFI